MNITFQENGNLPRGIYLMTIEEFEKEFGYTPHRKKLIDGLKTGMKDLQECGCSMIFIDGSFVTKKNTPGDFDACWNTEGVDLNKLKEKHEILLDFTYERKRQKEKYCGEFFPAHFAAQLDPYTTYYHFFQKDKENNPKGIVQINLK